MIYDEYEDAYEASENPTYQIPCLRNRSFHL